jgi:YD repeat-containing protein
VEHASETARYDGLGRRVERTRSLNGVTRSEVFTYDGLSRLTGVTVAGETTSYAYDAFGNRVREQSAAGVRHYDYDAAHQLRRVRSDGPSGALLGRFLFES